MEEEKKMELFGQFRKDPKLREAIEKTGIPEDTEETIKMLAGLAQEFGYALSGEDILDALSAAEKQRKADTEKTVEQIERLADDDLTPVAGGKYYKDCEDTYLDKENCFRTDGCDQHYNMYPEYVCNSNRRGGEDEQCGVIYAAEHCHMLLTWTCKKNDLWP